MKISVRSSKEVWKSPDGKIKIYDIVLDNGTILQTYSAKIAAGGEFEVESYEKGGRSFVKQPSPEQSFNAPRSSEKQFKADPDSRESIEWQTSLKAAIEAVRDYYLPTGFTGSLEDYAKDVDKVAVHFKNLINIKPTTLESSTPKSDEDIVREFMSSSSDLPPVGLYEGLE